MELFNYCGSAASAAQCLKNMSRLSLWRKHESNSPLAELYWLYWQVCIRVSCANGCRLIFWWHGKRRAPNGDDCTGPGGLHSHGCYLYPAKETSGCDSV